MSEPPRSVSSTGSTNPLGGPHKRLRDLVRNDLRDVGVREDDSAWKLHRQEQDGVQPVRRETPEMSKEGQEWNNQSVKFNANNARDVLD